MDTELGQGNQAGFVGDSPAPAAPVPPPVSPATLNISQPPASKAAAPAPVLDNSLDAADTQVGFSAPTTVGAPTPETAVQVASSQVPDQEKVYGITRKPLVRRSAVVAVALVIMTIGLGLLTRGQPGKNPAGTSDQPINLSALDNLPQSSSSTGDLNLNLDTTVAAGRKLTATGQVLLQNKVDSTSAFSVKDAAGASLINVDTKSGTVTISGKLDASNATLPSLQLAANVTQAGNSFNGASELVQLTAGGILPALDGSALTSLNASNVTLGTLSDARLSSNVALKNANNNTFKPGADSTDTFQIQNAAGTASLFNVDTTNRRVAINQSSANYTLDVNGDINVTAGGAIRINGVALCTGSGCIASGGSGSYIQNATSTQNANFAVQSADPSSVAGLVKAANGQTANIFQANDSFNDTVFSVGATGNILIQPSVDSINAFWIQNAAGTSHLIGGDTLNDRVAIAQPTPPNYTLDVGGDINSTTAIRVGGNIICSAGGCTPGAGSGSYIQNSTSLQTANFAIQSDANTDKVAVIRGASGQTADLLDLVAGDSGQNVASFGARGNVIFQNATDSTTAFQIQNVAGNSNLFIADTSNTRIGIGATPVNTLLTIGTNTNTSAGGVTFGTDTSLYRSAAGTLTLAGGTNHAGTLQAAAAIPADSVGANLILAGGQGTGVGSGGNINLQIAKATVSVPNQSFITGLHGPGSVAVNSSFIYWTNNTTNTIGRANLDGTGANQSFITGANGPAGITIDGNFIYWTNQANNTIGRANLDGTGANQSFITGASSPVRVTVDSSHIYWTNNTTNTIGRANLDGTGANQSFITGANGVYGVFVTTSFIYWTQYNGGTIGRANLDGTGANQSFITGATNPDGIVANSTYVFWANNSTTIGRANLDGTGANQSFITGANSPSGVTVDSNYLYWSNYNANTIGRYAFGTSPNSLTTVASLSGANGAALFQNAADSTTAFQIQNASGTNLFQADTTNMNIIANKPFTGDTGLWTKDPDTSSGDGTNGGFVTVNGYLYMISGNGNNFTTYWRLNADGSLSSPTTLNNNLPSGFEFTRAVASNSYVYLLGGCTTHNSCSTSMTQNVYYAKLNSDGSIGSWNTISNSLPRATLSYTTATAANGYIYLLGGQDGAGNTVGTVNYARINSDGTLGTWQTNSNSLPNTRQNASTVAANGYMYVIGGCNTGTGSSCNGNAQTTVYYAKLNSDGSTGTWQTNSNSLPIKLVRLSTATANGYVYAISGTKTDNSISTAIYYAKLNSDGSTGTWNTSGDTYGDVAGVSNTQATTANGYIYTESNRTEIVYASLGSTQVQGVGNFAQSVSVGGALNIAGSTVLQGNSNSVAAFQVNDARGASLLNVDTTNDQVTIASPTNNTTAFQIQNAAGTSLFTADTTNLKVSTTQLQASSTISSASGAANAQISWNLLSSTGLTMSGNEITDATRRTNTQGDGLTPPDSSTGIWESTTNMITNGGLESGTTGWSSSLNGTGAVSRSTTVAKFGNASYQATKGSDTNAYAVLYAPTTSVTIGQTYTFSAWVNVTAVSGSAEADLSIDNNPASSKSSAVTAVTNGWVRMYYTFTAATSSVSPRMNIELTGAETAYWDGAQMEQKAYATPYVETNGATASRSAARVQAPSAALGTSTTGWAATRFRTDVASTDIGNFLNGEAHLFDWEDSGGHGITAYFNNTNGLAITRAHDTGSNAAVTVGPFSKGTVFTLVFYWTGSTVAVSVNGGNFTTTNQTPAAAFGTMNSLFDIGSVANARWADGDFLWFAGGTGTLSNSDAATLNGYGNTDPALSSLTTLNSGAASPAMVWNGSTSSYSSSAGTVAQSALNLDDASLYRGAANTLQTNSNFLLQNSTDSTTAFQIQNTAGTSVLTVNTINGSISSPGTGSGSEHFGAASSLGSTTNSSAFGSSATVTGNNGTAIGASASAGVSSTAVGQGTTASNTGSIALGAGATTTANNQLVIGSNNAAIQNAYIGNGVTNVSPSSVTLQATGGSGTDVAGGSISIAGGQGTGVGNGGGINLQVAPPALSNVNQSFITGGSRPFGVAVDGSHIYWVNRNSNSIGRSNLDGTGVNQSFISGLSTGLTGLAVDSNFIYFGNDNNATIGRANIDGTGVNQSFITGATGVSAIAPTASFLYWVNSGAGYIGRSNLDGTGVNQTFIGPLSSALGIAVTSNNIYYSSSSNGGEIHRMNLDGTGNTVLFTLSPSDIPQNIAVNSTYIYLTNSNHGTIGRANIDGTGVNQNFVTGASSPYGIAINSTNVYWANANTSVNTIGRLTLGTAANTLSTVVSLSGLNGSALFKNAANSTTAFQIQNASGTALFTADTTNLQITLGAPSATPVVLVLGIKNTSGDPATCASGGIYYNSNSNQFRGCVNGTWQSLSSGSSSPQYVTSLPGSPTDGQEIYYEADPTNGIIWHLRYNASESTYHWEYLGGSMLSSTTNPTNNATSTSYGNVGGTAPAVTVPLTGVYQIRYGLTNTLKAGFISPGGCGISPTDNNAASAAEVQSGNAQSAGQITQATLTTSGGCTLTGNIRKSGTGDPSILYSYLFVTPVKVN